MDFQFAQTWYCPNDFTGMYQFLSDVRVDEISVQLYILQGILFLIVGAKDRTFA